MSAAVDTNILIYALGEIGEPRHRKAIDLLRLLSLAHGIIPAQALAECHRVMTRKFRRTAIDAENQIRLWTGVFDIAPTSATCLVTAAELSSRHHLQIFDAIIIASVAEAGCRVLFSEDMQHEAVFNGVTVINPFLAENHPMLLAALR